MLRFAGRRSIFIISICVLTVFFIYLGMQMSANSAVREPDYDVVNHGQQAWADTRVYIEDLFSGDLGSIEHELFGEITIWELLKDTYIKSMGLLGVAILASTLLGTSIGISAALIKNKRTVLAIMVLTILGVSTPSFFAGLLLQQGELRYLDIFGRPLVKMAGFGWDFDHMLMPVLVLMARPLAYLTRTSFIALDRILEENFIRTAYAKGLYRRRVVSVHALKNIAIPVLTAVGVSLRFSLSTLPVVEFFFSWPGIGLRLLEAIDARHDRLVVTLALTLGLTLLLVNLLLDLFYRFIDPRIRQDA
jgi:peptide/nickel transport system permease protein